jgi:hypothetical protein
VKNRAAFRRDRGCLEVGQILQDLDIARGIDSSTEDLVDIVQSNRKIRPHGGTREIRLEHN